MTSPLTSRNPGAALRPVRRGDKTCLCVGHLHESKGHYGWIMPHCIIDHREAWKHRGAIYLKVSDIRPGSSLKKGDPVLFYLYADHHGLGAEDCHPKPAGVAAAAAGVLSEQGQSTACTVVFPSLNAERLNAGREASAPAWLLEDSTDEDDDSGKDKHAEAKQATSDTDSTTCGSSPGSRSEFSPGQALTDQFSAEGGEEEGEGDFDDFDALQAELRQARAAASVLTSAIEATSGAQSTAPEQKSGPTKRMRRAACRNRRRWQELLAATEQRASIDSNVAATSREADDSFTPESRGAGAPCVGSRGLAATMATMRAKAPNVGRRSMAQRPEANSFAAPPGLSPPPGLSHPATQLASR